MRKSPYTVLVGGLAVFLSSALPGCGERGDDNLLTEPIVTAGTGGTGSTDNGGVLDDTPPGPFSRDFFIRWMNNTCFDFGPTVSNGSGKTGPVYLTPVVAGKQMVLIPCKNTVSQIIRSVEVGPEREIELRAKEFCLGPQNGALTPVTPIVLQTCSGASTQRWLFDGDTFRNRSNEQMVITRNAMGIGLVLTRREFVKTEFFSPIDTLGGPVYPHRGFWDVNIFTNPAWSCCDGTSCPGSTGRPGLKEAVACAKANEVVVVTSSFPAFGPTMLELAAGATLRGRPFSDGRLPQITVTYPTTQTGEVRFVHANHAAGRLTRVTSISVRGCLHETASPRPNCAGVAIWSTRPEHPAVVDNADFTAFNYAGIEVSNGDNNMNRCEGHESAISKDVVVKVLNNFFHANNDGMGYGVVVASGAQPLIQGNVFDENRHAISADGKPHTAFVARDNIVQYTGVQPNWAWEHDFDMHGSGEDGLADNKEDNGTGGIAGLFMDVVGNTFIGNNRLNFKLRGNPCSISRGLYFAYNVSRQSKEDTVRDVWDSYEVDAFGNPLFVDDVHYLGNRWNSSDPMKTLGIDDFDGDGKDDLFLATGAAWYYSSSGQQPWRLLNTSQLLLNEVRFGDFDGDGLADVLFSGANATTISWNARKIQRVHEPPVPMADVLVGDFAGDGKSDILWANGVQWLISDDGVGAWRAIAIIPKRASELRIGDFNGDKRSDILFVNGSNWSILTPAAGARSWRTEHLRAKLNDTLGWIGDLDGNGISDVVTVPNPTSSALTVTVSISFGGRSDWIRLTIPGDVYPNTFRGPGKFSSTVRDDLAFLFMTLDFPISRPKENSLFLYTPVLGTMVKHSFNNMH